MKVSGEWGARLAGWGIWGNAMGNALISLNNNRLILRFPHTHAEAVAQLDFQRTLRIPDDGKTYPLPPDLGSFPLRHIEDFVPRVPSAAAA